MHKVSARLRLRKFPRRNITDLPCQSISKYWFLCRKLASIESHACQLLKSIMRKFSKQKKKKAVRMIVGKRGGQVRSGDELNCFLKQEICEKVTEWQKSKKVEWKLVSMRLLCQCPADWSDLCCIYYLSTCVLIYIDFFVVSYQIKPSSHLEKPRSKNCCFLYAPTSFENKISKWKLNRRLSSIRHFRITYPPLKLFNSVTKKRMKYVFISAGLCWSCFLIWAGFQLIWIKHCTFVIKSYTFHVPYCVWFLSFSHLLDLSYQ